MFRAEFLIDAFQVAPNWVLIANSVCDAVHKAAN